MPEGKLEARGTWHEAFGIYELQIAAILKQTMTKEISIFKSQRDF